MEKTRAAVLARLGELLATPTAPDDDNMTMTGTVEAPFGLDGTMVLQVQDNSIPDGEPGRTTLFRYTFNPVGL